MDVGEAKTVAKTRDDVNEKVPEPEVNDTESNVEEDCVNDDVVIKAENSTASNANLDVSEAEDSNRTNNNNNFVMISSRTKNYKNVILKDWDCETPQVSAEKQEKKNGDVDMQEKIVAKGAEEKQEEPDEANEANAPVPEKTTEELVTTKANKITKEMIKPVLGRKKNALKFSNLIVSNQDIVEILDNSMERICRPIVPAKDIFLSIELTKHLNQFSPRSLEKKIVIDSPDTKNMSNENQSTKIILSEVVAQVHNVENKEGKNGDLIPEKPSEDQNKKGKKKARKKQISLGDEMERTIALRQLRDEFPTTRRRSHTTKNMNHIPFLASSDLEKALTSTVSTAVETGSPRRRPCYLPDNTTSEKSEELKKSVGEGSESDEKNQKEMKLSDLSNTAPVVRTYCIKRKSTETENDVKSALQTFPSVTKDFQEGDEENIESKPKKQKTEQQKAQKTGKVQPKKRKTDGSGNKKRNLELEKLLGDEGAVRMLYETQHKDDASRFSGKKSKTTVGLKKDLMLKTKLVKNAVLRLSGANSDGVSLRGKRRSTKSETDVTPDADALFSTSTPNVILYKPKKKQRAEASRILYRHSSSESFDSNDEDERKKGSEEVTQNGETATDSSLANGDFFKHKSESDEGEEEGEEVDDGSKKSKAPKKTKMVGGKRVKDVKGKSDKEGTRESVDSQNNSKFVWANVPVRKSCRPRVISKKYSIWSSTSMDSLSVESLGLKKAKKASQELTKKLNCKELRIIQHGNLVQIVLSSSSTVLKNSFNEQVLTELKEALDFLSEQESCTVVLLTSTGTMFCQGIDLNYVLSVEEDDRKQTFGNLLNCLEKLILCLADYKKPIVAGVHAGAIGLGVTLLAYCDIVISSDRAFYYTPYARLGQVSEGAATITFPRISKNLVTELLYKSEKISALEAMKLGLVSQVIPEERFEEELMLTARRIASHSVQAMQSMKSLINKKDYERIVEMVDAESQLILEHWCSNECINNIIKFLNSGEVQFRPLDVT